MWLLSTIKAVNEDIKKEINFCRESYWFWDFLMVDQIFFSIQVKPSVIISDKIVYKGSVTSCRTN